MPSERRFRDDSTKAARFDAPDDGDDRMNEDDEDVAPAGIVSNLKKSQKSNRFCISPPTGPPSPTGRRVPQEQAPYANAREGPGWDAASLTAW